MARASAVTPLFLIVVFPLVLLGCPRAYPRCDQDTGAQQCAREPEAPQAPREETSARGGDPALDGVTAALEAPGTGDIPLPFGHPMTPPEKLSGPAPEYTRGALDHRAEGIAIVQCVITREGEVRDCRLLQPVAYMESAVLTALAQSRFKPATLNGKPLAVTYTLSFELHPPSPR